MRKIAIVMTCFNRNELVENSISSVVNQKYENYKIIVVDDMSDIPFKFKHPNVDIIRTENKTWVSSVIAYNIGIKHAIEIGAEIIILQNGESYHFGDLLQYANDNLNAKNYISFASLNLSKERSSNIKDETMDSLLSINVASGDEAIGWYNHSVYRPVAYDFCSAIETENLIKLNGFDERFSNHFWYMDDDFLNRVRKMGLNVEIVDMPFVVHQFHSRGHQGHFDTVEAWQLYTLTMSEPTYKAIHTITTNF